MGFIGVPYMRTLIVDCRVVVEFAAWLVASSTRIPFSLYRHV